jgi:hypothetical protein
MDTDAATDDRCSIANTVVPTELAGAMAPERFINVGLAKMGTGH